MRHHQTFCTLHDSNSILTLRDLRQIPPALHVVRWDYFLREVLQILLGRYASEYGERGQTAAVAKVDVGVETIADHQSAVKVE